MSASILSTAKALTASRQDWLEGENIPVWEGGGIAAVIKRQGGYVGLCFTVNHKPIDETYTLLMLDGSTWHPFIQDSQAYDNWRRLIVPKINDRLKPRVSDDSEALWVTEPEPETPTETFLRRIQQQMAIKGLTDRGDAFPRIGTLRKGSHSVERVNKKGEKYNSYGKDLTYFRFDCQDENSMADFKAAYGDEPSQINCFLPYIDHELNFMTAQEHWVAGGLMHRCDGETCTLHRTADGTYSEDPIPCPGECKAVGRLNIIIPELGRLGFVTALTQSKNDIIELTANLKAAELAAGDLRTVPFILKRVPRNISTPDPQNKGKRIRREKWLLTLEIHPTFVNQRLKAMQKHALTAGASLPQMQLDAGEPIIDEDDFDDDDGVIEMAALPEPAPAPVETNEAKSAQLQALEAFYQRCESKLSITDDEARAIIGAAGITGGFNPEKAAEFFDLIKTQLEQPTNVVSLIVSTNLATDHYYDRSKTIPENQYHIVGSIKKIDDSFELPPKGQNPELWQGAKALAIEYAQMNQLPEALPVDSDDINDWFPRETETEPA